MSFVARIDQCGLVSQSGVYEHCAACFPILVPWSSGLLTSIRPDVHLSSASATSHTNDRGAAQCSWKQLSFVGQRSCPGRQGFLDRPRIYRRKEKLLLQISGEESEESSEESDASAKLGYVDHEIPIDVRVPPHRHKAATTVTQLATRCCSSFLECDQVCHTSRFVMLAAKRSWPKRNDEPNSSINCTVEF